MEKASFARIVDVHENLTFFTLANNIDSLFLAKPKVVFNYLNT